MLYLKQAASQANEALPPRSALSEPAAACLERALLAADRNAQLRELAAAMAADDRFAGWALRMAEHRLGRTVNHVAEAQNWLCDVLATELAESLVSDDTPATGDIAQRMPALAKKLAACEQELTNFHRRLEHEKLEALKELAYGASHEINNPLANIAARAQTLLEEESDPERRRKLTAIHRQAMRAHEMISDLMLFARPPKLKPIPCELQPLVRGVVDRLGKLAKETETELVFESAGESIELLADETQLAVAIHALIVNSLEAVGSGGHVSVAAGIVKLAERAWAEVVVRDDGPGIPPEIRQHLFDPFFSGREAGRGLGFGLSKCWRVVTDHGGEVLVRQSTGGGAEISLRLPLVMRHI
jgi:signal transduction histidine kinase